MSEDEPATRGALLHEGMLRYYLLTRGAHFSVASCCLDFHISSDLSWGK